MKLVVIVLLGLLASTSPLLAEESANPHHMLKPDGQLDMNACGVCHESDLSLSRSKLETCTLCHGMTPHAGALEHITAPAADVKQLLSGEGEPNLPLTDKGKIYCGTCHLFHDPAMGGEQPLKHAWVPLSSGLSGVVGNSLAAQWQKIAQKYGQSEVGAKLDTKGTKALRLPINDGSLCLHCHKGMQ